MGFGNPYGDHWTTEVTAEWTEMLLQRIDPDVISIADTIGAATPEVVKDVFQVVGNLCLQKNWAPHLTFTPWKGWTK